MYLQLVIPCFREPYSISVTRPGGQVDEVIQSGQAFFVYRTGAIASLEFNETDKSTTAL